MTVRYRLDFTDRENLGRIHMIFKLTVFLAGDGLRLFLRQITKHLWACHVSHFDWVFYRIEASLRLPCILGIYITPHNPHFFISQTKHIVRAQPSSLSEQSVAHTKQLIIQPSTPSYFKERWVLLLLYASFLNLAVIYRQTYTTVNTLRSVSLRFCRHL